MLVDVIAKALIRALESPAVMRLMELMMGRKNDEQLAELHAEFARVHARLTKIEQHLGIQRP